MANSRQVAVKPFFGGFVLETLTVGMYGEARNAIREYVQNAFDSIKRATNNLGILREGDGRIEIIMAADKDGLIIRDNGAGLPVKSAAETLTRVGASTKDYTTDAGFRGIGRLAGIVFSNTVRFTTKARGETEMTTVVFKADEMRNAMTPAKGSTMSAEELIRECVEAFIESAENADDHFFEVSLDGFVDAPEECTSFKLLQEFISQIAPVPYDQTFPFRDRLAAAADECQLPIEVVNITLQDGSNDPVPVQKLYGNKYLIESGEIELADCEIRVSRDKNWWAWIGKKEESGSYVDARVRGLRVRMKNIQIDGSDVVREIFQRQARSHIRFQDWYVGEIFVRPSFLVPNAGRDGFEETAAWKRMRRDLGELIRELGSQSYDVSNRGQLTIDALEAKVAEKRGELENLRRQEFRNQDRTLAISADITGLHKRIARASKDADLPTHATLQALGAELTDIKAEAISHIVSSAPRIDVEQVQQEARDELLKELRFFADRAAKKWPLRGSLKLGVGCL
jgi:hypothetical protein